MTGAGQQELPDGLELSATETFRQYVKDVEVRRQARIMEKGERLIQELEAAEGAQRMRRSKVRGAGSCP